LADTILEAIADAADPEQAAHYLRSFFARVRHPGIYTTHLAKDPTAVRRLVAALGASAFVGEAVASRAELGDLMVFGRDRVSPATAWEEVMTAAQQPLEPVDDEPLIQRQVGLLRRAQSGISAQVALADLAGEIDPRTAMLTLSALADGTLEAAARFTLQTAPKEDINGLAIVAMGKLGARAIGYGSDLDVIFVYDPEAAPRDPVEYYSRCARQIIQLISMPHPDGPGYQLDTRLRPSGSQGLLVVSLDAFRRYHDVSDLEPAGAGASPAEARVEALPVSRGRRAGNWERLALTRARFAAGDRRLGDAVAAIAETAAFDFKGEISQLAQDIHQLRKRMEHELARERPGRYDVKFGRGGLVDVEFSVQLLQMQHGAAATVRTTDTAQAIEALTALGALDEPHATWLRDGYRFLMRLQERMRIVHADSVHLLEGAAAGLGPLARRMGFRDLPQTSGAEALLDRYREVTERVRKSYEAIVVGAIGDNAASD